MWVARSAFAPAQRKNSCTVTTRFWWRRQIRKLIKRHHWKSLDFWSALIPPECYHGKLTNWRDSNVSILYGSATSAEKTYIWGETFDSWKVSDSYGILLRFSEIWPPQICKLHIPLHRSEHQFSVNLWPKNEIVVRFGHLSCFGHTFGGSAPFLSQKSVPNLQKT